MNETTRDPREDISFIRRVLERTTDDMRSLAPWFKGFGVLWLVYGLLTAAQNVLIQHLPLPWPMYLALSGTLLGWLFYAVLAAGFFAVRRRQQGLDTLARKLMDMWGVCIVLFLVLCVGLAAVPHIAVRALGLGMEQVGAMSVTCALIRSHLFFLLPIAPLLMTALFLENRRMLWIGVSLAVFGGLFLGCNTLLMYAGGLSVDRNLALGSNAAACLLNIVPGVMLLVFGRELKRM